MHHLLLCCEAPTPLLWYYVEYYVATSAVLCGEYRDSTTHCVCSSAGWCVEVQREHTLCVYTSAVLCCGGEVVLCTHYPAMWHVMVYVQSTQVRMHRDSAPTLYYPVHRLPGVLCSALLSSGKVR